jgi:predicted solute-binding protein
MRLLLDDAFATTTYTLPFSAGWVSAPEGFTVELVKRLTTDDVSADDVALVPSAALPRLQATHDVLADVAVVADGVGDIAMRTPVRPDEVETTPVRLLDTSGTAEILARATLMPFFGIQAMTWFRDDAAPEAARAQVVIVQGAEALREPEDGFSEDLARAWFILTGQPVISHVLVMPRELHPSRRQDVTAFFASLRSEGASRRSEWRPRLADALGVGKDRASAFWTAQRLSLGDTDRQALLDLLAQGSPGTSGSFPLNVQFLEGAGSA